MLSLSRSNLLILCMVTLSCVGFAYFLASGCGRQRVPKDVSRAERVAKMPAGDNNQAIREFVEAEGFPGLKRILDESDSSTARMVAITGLGMLKDNAEATQLLIQIVNGEDPEESYWAIIAIADQGAPEAKELITKAIESDDARRREGACTAIMKYGDESLYPLLNAALNDPDSGVKGAARRAKLFIREGQVVMPGQPPRSGVDDGAE